MISKELKEFLTNPALAFTIGTRDANLQPCAGRGCGVSINEGDNTITVLVPKSVVEPHLLNLKNNGRMAFTAIFPGTHGSFQIKGQYQKHEDATETDHQMIERNLIAWKELLTAFYGPAAATNYDTLIFKPAVGITIKIEDIFNQTPGVGAGKKIN
jgi:hypothetical protein